MTFRSVGTRDIVEDRQTGSWFYKLTGPKPNKVEFRIRTERNSNTNQRTRIREHETQNHIKKTARFSPGFDALTLLWGSMSRRSLGLKGFKIPGPRAGGCERRGVRWKGVDLAVVTALVCAWECGRKWIAYHAEWLLESEQVWVWTCECQRMLRTWLACWILIL